MTYVAIDPARCHAYGLCVAIHPDVFAVPPGSPQGVVIREVLTDDDLDDVREAVRSCPSSAITLTADD